MTDQDKADIAVKVLRLLEPTVREVVREEANAAVIRYIGEAVTRYIQGHPALDRHITEVVDGYIKEHFEFTVNLDVRRK